MFNIFKSKQIPFDKIETVIGENTSFNGHLKCDGNIRIDGLCEDGIIETVGNVLVTVQGKVAAKIIAQNVSVAGEVTGTIEARGRLEIIGEGRVSGDVNVANFYKDEGATLEGTLSMGDEKVSSDEEEKSGEKDDVAEEKAPENKSDTPK